MSAHSVLFVDNYDSFTYNVVHLLAAHAMSPDVILNDDERLVPELLDRYGLLVIGPGPGSPSQKPRMMNVLGAAIERGMPVFGVCLGMQAIGEALHARVAHAPAQMHGKTSAIEHDGSGIFEGIPSPFEATRYHSLALDPASIPDILRVTARSSDGVVQAIAHTALPLYGVQFHPESILSEHGGEIVENLFRLAGVDRPVAR
ncbi:MAG: aminodeoxychorismate/anthranilate synthase component II [Candidatus Eremiobacteraeota bacterium]|nr:aminodeoxychorismate/anthranilate synthase component II [Candidatus Eremiobacteraeota bacterium]